MEVHGVETKTGGGGRLLGAGAEMLLDATRFRDARACEALVVHTETGTGLGTMTSITLVILDLISAWAFNTFSYA